MAKAKQIETLFPEKAPELTSENLPVNLITGPLLGDPPSASLVESVKRVGILVPILVQKIAKGESYYVVDGRRRLRAASLAGLKLVPAQVIPASVENPEAFTLQANMTRKPNPVSEYLAIKGLIDRNFTEEAIVKELGIKASVIKKRLAFGKLIPTLYDLLEAGHIAASVAEAAAKLPVASQERLIETFAKNDDKLTFKDIAEEKRVKRSESETSLSDVIFGGTDKAKADAKAALSHIEAAAELLKGIGEEVDLSDLRSKLSKLAK